MERSPKHRRRVSTFRLSCHQCGAMFEAHKCNAKFCSKKCYNQYSYRHVGQNSKKESRYKSPTTSPATVANDVDSELITVAETALRLKVSRQTIYNLIRSNNIPYIRLSRRLTYIRWSQLTAMNGYTQAEQKAADHSAPSVAHAKAPLPVNDDTSVDWLTVKQACERYHVQPQTFYNRVRGNNELLKRQKRRLTFYRKDDLDRLFGKPLESQDGYISIAAYSLKHGICAATIRNNLPRLGLKTVRQGRTILFSEDEFIAAYKRYVHHPNT